MPTQKQEDSDITTDLGHIQELLSNLSPFTEVEDTVFSVGGRGYYENATTDILAFFLNPDASHNMGTAILEALLEASGLAGLEYPGGLYNPPFREVATPQGNRIDLILEGYDWVLIIENKIRHTLENPLDNYVAYAETAYPDKEKYFLILAPYVAADQNGIWKSVSYQSLIDSMNQRLPDEITEEGKVNKWAVHLREFIKNLEAEATDNHMDDKTFIELETHSVTLYKAIKLSKRLEEEIRTRVEHLLSDAIPGITIQSTTQSWQAGPAFRFRSDRWFAESGVTIYSGFKSGKCYEIFSIVDIPDQDLHTYANQIFDRAHYNEELKGQGDKQYLKYTHKSEPNSFEELTEALIDTVKRLDQVEHHRNDRGQP